MILIFWEKITDLPILCSEDPLSLHISPPLLYVIYLFWEKVGKVAFLKLSERNFYQTIRMQMPIFLDHHHVPV